MSPQTLGPEVVGQHEKILGYGKPKTGKTFAGGTMPGRVYFLCVGGENELKTLTSPDFLEKYPEKRGKIQYDWVREERGKRGKFKKATAFDKACDKLDEALELDADPDEEFGFDSLVIDNATMLNQYQMDKAMEINHGRSSGGETAVERLRKYDIRIPGDNDWQSQMSLMTQFIEWLFELDKHVFVIAHEYKETERQNRRDEKVVGIRPQFTGKNRQNIPLHFDNVWRFNYSGGGKSRQYEVQTQGDDTVLAGTRFGGVFPKTIRDINMADCIERMQKRAKELAEE